MPLDTTNFHPQGPVKSVDLMQFVNLFTGVMVDQPITFSNSVTLGGNQGLTTVPLRVYGAVGQNTNLIDLYADKNQAQPGFGFSAAGRFAWGPGGASPQDTFLSRIATQNGHSSDTPGLLITPTLEVTGTVSALGYNYTNGASIVAPAGNPSQLNISQDLTVARYVALGGSAINTTNALTITTAAMTGVSQLGINLQPTFSTAATNLGCSLYITPKLAAGSASTVNFWGMNIDPPVVGSGRTVNTMIGLRVQNMGNAAWPTSYALYIDPQSGSTTTNVGIYNAAPSSLGAQVGIDGGYSPGWSLFVGNTKGNGGAYLTGYLSVANVNGVSPGIGILSAGAIITLYDVSIARWNAGQLRVYSNNNAGLTVNGPIVVETNYALQFAVNGYTLMGQASYPWIRCSGDFMVDGGNLYLGTSAAVKIYFDGVNIHTPPSYPFVAESNFKCRAGDGNYFSGTSDQSILGIWNPGEWRVKSASAGNFRAVGVIVAEGGPVTGNGAYVNSASSERLKHDIVELVPTACLAQVNDPRMRPVSYEYNDPLPQDRANWPILDAPFVDWQPDRLGFIAEEVKRVIPQAVGMLGDQAEGLSVEMLLPVLWGAVRALSAKVEQLERAA